MRDCFYALADEEQLGMGKAGAGEVGNEVFAGYVWKFRDQREKLFNQIVAFISRTNDLHYLRHYRIDLSGHLTLLRP